MAEPAPASTALRILMLEDSALDAELIGAQLRRADVHAHIDRVWEREPFIEALRSADYQVILADHVMPNFDGDSALALAREMAPRVPFIFVSGTLTEELAVQALTRGARDYVVKQRLQRLPDAILRAVAEASKRDRLAAAEAALDESRGRMQLITDALPAMIANLDNQHRFRFANQSYLNWHGLELQQLVGRHATDIAGTASFEESRIHLEQVLTGERQSFEVERRHRDGTLHVLQVDCVPERTTDGSVAGYIVLSHDITALKQVQRALREANESLEHQVQARTRELQRSQQRLQAVFQSSFQHQVLLDLRGRVVDANVASLDAVLTTRQSVLGQLFAQSAWFSSTPEAGATVTAAIADAIGGRASRHEIELELPSGRRSFEFSLRPLLDSDGGVAAVVSEAVETTARRHAEHALRQSQKIEAVGQLTGGIAHDFNNILTVIAGNIEHVGMLNERADATDPRMSRALDSALKAVGRAAGLTQRLLAFARRQPLRSEAGHLGDHVGGMHEMLQRTLGELVQLEIRTADDLWCVELDPGQLEASVLNLAVNARDAMPDGGNLRIEVDNSHLETDYVDQYPGATPGEYVMLRVSDSGHGMPADVVAKVFEPFFTTKEVGRGTGLGLSMVHGFVLQSGGHVFVKSIQGVGTTITLMFPRSSLPLPAAVEPVVELGDFEDGDGRTILLVEDNDDVRAYAVDALRQFGYRVLEAHDGPSALRLLERPDTRIDLLFSDIVMPGMSGWELARQVRAKLPQLPVLFASGYPKDHQGADEQGRTAPMLAKPFTRRDLDQAVRRAMGQATA